MLLVDRTFCFLREQAHPLCLWWTESAQAAVVVEERGLGVGGVPSGECGCADGVEHEHGDLDVGVSELSPVEGDGGAEGGDGALAAGFQDGVARVLEAGVVLGGEALGKLGAGDHEAEMGEHGEGQRDGRGRAELL